MLYAIKKCGMEVLLSKKVWIYKPGKQATQSGLYKTKTWVLEFAVLAPKFVDPVMGWIGSTSTEDHHRIFFETRADAIQFAKKEGLEYSVVPDFDSEVPPKNYSDIFFGNLGKL